MADFLKHNKRKSPGVKELSKIFEADNDNIIKEFFCRRRGDVTDNQEMKGTEFFECNA